MKSRVLVLSAVALFVAAPFAAAQQVEPPHLAELRFVSELRKRGDTALALEYLERLSNSPSPELAKELPFEKAKMRLLLGTDEPESAKRLNLYLRARGEFEDFLAKNPDSPRAGEARLEIAHVSVLQAKTQLSKALSQDTLEGRIIEANKARRLFLDAGTQLDAAYAELEAQLKKVPETDKLRRKKLESDLLQAELSRALNLFDQSQTFLNLGSNDELRARGDVIENAAIALKAISDKDNGTIGWQATAWLARCQQLLGTPKKARDSLAKLLSIPVNAGNSAAIADAHRIGLYFQMLLNRENPEADNKEPVFNAVTAGRKWLTDYKHKLNTPEGYGVRYFVADNLIALVESPPKGFTEDKKKSALQEARDLLKDLEHSENDYTDRARRLKITLSERQGDFKVALDQLKTFDACYLRSQYEIFMIAKDLEGAKDIKEREAKIKARRDAAMKALELGLAKPDAKNSQGKYTYEANNARLSLAYHFLNNGNYKEAIKTAEELARDIHASQAPTAAAYAMQAHAQYLAEREQKVASKDELKPDRDKLLEFAKFAEEKWPDELAANLARHQVGLMLLRDRQLAEAIRKLNTITMSYPNYAQVKYLIAESCLAAEKAKLDPLKDLGSYSELAMKALTSIPDSMLGSPDPEINRAFFFSRIMMGQEYFKAKKYAEMEKLATPLLPRVATTRLALDDKRNAQLQTDITTSLNNILLYAKFGLAEGEFKDKKYAKVMEMLGPIVAEINEDKHPELKTNPQLSTALLTMALKATIQLNALDQTKAILNAMQKVGGDSEGASNMLLQLADLIQNQMDDLKKKDDKDGLNKATKAFRNILNDLDKAQKNKTMDFTCLLAKNYAVLDLHDRAADILERVELPAKTGMKEADEKNERVYHTVRAAYIRELRLSGDKDKAKELLEKGMGTPKEPGWAAANVDANLERVLLLEDDGKFAVAAKLSDQWVNKLKAKAESDVQVREKYLEFYYHTSYCYFKHGVGLREKDKAKGDKTIKEAAAQLVQLEKAWKGFGSDLSTRRIQELLDKEPDLKAQYEAAKKQ